MNIEVSATELSIIEQHRRAVEDAKKYNHSCSFDGWHPANRDNAIGIMLNEVQCLLERDLERRLQVIIYPVPYMRETLRAKEPFIIQICDASTNPAR